MFTEGNDSFNSRQGEITINAFCVTLLTYSLLKDVASKKIATIISKLVLLPSLSDISHKFVFRLLSVAKIITDEQTDYLEHQSHRDDRVEEHYEKKHEYERACDFFSSLCIKYSGLMAH